MFFFLNSIISYRSCFFHPRYGLPRWIFLYNWGRSLLDMLRISQGKPPYGAGELNELYELIPRLRYNPCNSMITFFFEGIMKLSVLPDGCTHNRSFFSLLLKKCSYFRILKSDKILMRCFKDGKSYLRSLDWCDAIRFF